MHPGAGQVTAAAGWGACILDAEGPRLSAAERALFARVAPFGFILFARNIENAAQVRALCDEMRQAAGHDAPIFVDQEGGRVARLRPPLARGWPPPLEHVRAAGARAERAMYLRHRVIAAELRGLGIDGNCAPLVDVAGPHTHAFLRDRCYGGDAARVARLGRAVALGLMSGGVLPVMKHIPGHGRATADSHAELPGVTTPLATLEATDFAPFRVLGDLPLAMTAHVVYRALDDRPATLSPRVIGHVRRGIGFDGLLMTDDISMQALHGAPDALAAQARAAGCDVVLLCNADLKTRAAVADAAGRLRGRGAERAAVALAARCGPDKVDMGHLNVMLDRLSPPASSAGRGTSDRGWS